jgi:secreted PhoX family phosphatase
VIGTFGNCSGGTTPWGTILSGEENFHHYFVGDPHAVGSDRYGLTQHPSVYGWETIDQRFDATQSDYAAEPRRFGYIIEVDPYDPKSTPRKHTALGRFKHEAANIRVGADGAVAAYMGDDERFEYLYVRGQEEIPPGTSISSPAQSAVATDGDLLSRTI